MKISRGIVPCAKKILLYGPEGIGKSTLAAQFPEPVFIDTEGSTSHMDVSRFEAPSSWQMLLSEVQYVIDHPDTCKTFVIDTADWAERMEIEELCRKKGWDGLEGAGYGRGYQYSAEEFGKLLNKLTEVIHKGINVVMTAHAQLRKVELPEEMGAYDHWEMKTSKKVAPMIREWADGVFFLNYKTVIVNVDGKGQTKGKNKAQGGRRVMYTTHTPFWDAKNRFGLPDELPLEYASIAHILQDPAQVPQAAPSVEAQPQMQPKTETAPPVPVTQNVPVPSSGHEQQVSLEDVEPVSLNAPIGVNDPPSEEDFFATEKTYYRQNGIVYEFLKGQRLPIRFLNNSAPSSEEEYRAYLKKKAQEDIRTVRDKPDAKGSCQEPDMRIPKKLRDLMIENQIEEWEIKDLVGAKGYFPPDMPVADYPPEFIDGWCIGYWDQVKTAVMEIREKQAFEIK